MTKKLEAKIETEIFFVIDSENAEKIFNRMQRLLKKGSTYDHKILEQGFISGIKDLEIKIYKPGKTLLKRNGRRKN